jgi:hypothetical protein
VSLLKRRSRLLSFRLTQDEFDGLRAACLVKGARNVSDFARTAVLASFSSSERRLADIEDAIERNTKMLHTLVPSRRVVSDVAEDTPEYLERPRSAGQL